MNMLKTTKVLCLAVAGWVGCAVGATCTIDDVKWSFDATSATEAKITGAVHTNDTTISGDLVFPSKVKSDTAGENATEYTVTSIGKEAFDEKTLITSITLPDSITLIGTGIGTSTTFYKCTGLKKAVMPGVIIVGRRAFGGCTALTDVEMPNVEQIGEMGFSGCNKLKDVSIPKIKLLNQGSSGKVLSGVAFTSIALADVSIIPSSCFENCESLKTVDGPHVTETYSKAFTGCDVLTDVVLPRITTLGAGTFRICTNLKNISMPRMKSFNRNANTGMIDSSALVSFKFPFTMTTNCYSRTSAGKNYSPFSCDVGACDKLEVIGIHKSSKLWMEMAASEEFYSTITNALLQHYDSSESFNSKLTIVPYGGSIIGANGIVWIYDDLNMPEGTVKLAAATNTTETVVIPDTLTIDGVEKRVTELEVSAFIDDPVVKKIQLGKYVETVDVYAFDGCTSLTTIGLTTAQEATLKPKLIEEYGEGRFTYQIVSPGFRIIVR